MFSPQSLQWLQASLLPGCGPVTLKQLHDKPGHGQHLLQGLLQQSPPALQKTVLACQQWAGEAGNHLIGITDADYPPLLLQIPDPPPVLFARGAVETLSMPQIAMVGSRKPSPDGRRQAERFARELAQGGYVITSGLALGIDGESHTAALEAGGRTIAVLGSGLDRLYPRRHRKLAEDILEGQGVLVSEFLPDCEPHAGNFPRRNRIISGLAHGVIVVEAALQSGSLITARYAAEQGREVFSIPGSIRNPLVRGCHELIRRGAKLTESTADIIEELGALLAWEQMRCPVERNVQVIPAKMEKISQEAQLLCRQLGHDPVTVDELATATGLAIPQVAAALAMLELQGRVDQHEGRFVLSGR
jgi:DNA processing protein